MKNYFVIAIFLLMSHLSLWGIQSGLEVSDSTVTEADEGTSQIFFRVNISATSPEAMEIFYSTSDGTAKEGVDYIKTAGSFTLPANQFSHDVVVSVINDRNNKIGDKYFYLNIDSKILPLFRGRAKGIILENDPPKHKALQENKQGSKSSKAKD